MLALVQGWSATNPSRNTSVLPIEIRTQSDTSEELQAVNGPGGCVATPLDPPGPVSLLLWYTDPLYRGGTLTLRNTILREKLMELGLRVENECKGHRWQRKKILEQLAAQQTAAVSPPQDTHELDDALCFLMNFQKIILDDIHKKVLHFPRDLRTWSAENPVWTTSLGSRCVFHLPGEKTVAAGLGSWLLILETEGWKITWPIAEGSAEEIKKRCAEMNLNPTVEKPKKEDYAKLLGRSDAVKALLREFH